MPLSKSISLSLNRFLFSESLTGDNKWFCPECNGFMDSTRETKTVDSGSILILQLLRYNNFIGAVIKNNMRVNCWSETLMLSISADKQLGLFKKFNLNNLGSPPSTTPKLCKLAVIRHISRMRTTVTA